MRLSRLLVLFPDRVPNPRDHSLAEKVACLILQDSHRGLPSHMRESVIECVEEFARTGSIAHYWWMCLIAVQARPGDESPETIFLRRELESIFYTLLVDTCP